LVPAAERSQDKPARSGAALLSKRHASPDIARKVG
jgi:hypothetical protein